MADPVNFKSEAELKLPPSAAFRSNLPELASPILPAYNTVLLMLVKFISLLCKFIDLVADKLKVPPAFKLMSLSACKFKSAFVRILTLLALNTFKCPLPVISNQTLPLIFPMYRIFSESFINSWCPPAVRKRINLSLSLVSPSSITN